jgi:type I restriction enzyme, S subunit
MSIQSETLRTPKLRFPEFSGEWEDYSLNTISNLITKGTTPTSIGFDFISEGVNFIKVENIKNHNIDINSTTKISYECHNHLKRSKLQSSDIVFSIAGTIGRTGIIADKDLPANTNQALSIIRLKKEQNIKFIHNLLNLEKIHKYSFRMLSVGAQPNLSLQQVREIKLNLPTKPEQQKIALFLSSVDKKIEQLSKKQELLHEYKKGLMQKILSQAIRFKADDSSDYPDWEEKKLQNIVSTPVSDGPHLTPKFVNQGIPFLSVDNLVKNKIDFSNARYISIDDHLIFSKKCKPKKDDVLFGKAASVGKVAFVETEIEFNIWSPIAMIRPSESNYSKYIFYCLQTEFILRQINRFTNSSSQGNIGMGDIGKIIIKLPNKLEQTKIANFLSSIDSKIEQLVKQLDETKQFKKALLQQMFV